MIKNSEIDLYGDEAENLRFDASVLIQALENVGMTRAQAWREVSRILTGKRRAMAEKLAVSYAIQGK